MKQNKMGAITLSGFLIGPILGSGILILPTIVFNIAKEWAIWAWVSIIAVSFIVAFIFGYISIQFPGDGGVTNAIEHTLGKHIKHLAAFYLIIGVIFGASAVLLAASQYIEKVSVISPIVISYILLIICIILLLTKINFLGKISFAMSTISAIVLFLGGAKSLFDYPKAISITNSFITSNFCYSLLILFWAIFGWEIIGNYSADVLDPKKTIPKAIIMSLSVISTVDLIVAAAIQWTDTNAFWSGQLTIAAILFSLFGNMSNFVVAILSLFLCCSTYFLYAGGISRLVSSLADNKVLPRILCWRSKNNVPFVSVLLIFLLNLSVFLLVQANIFNLESLVTFKMDPVK